MFASESASANKTMFKAGDKKESRTVSANVNEHIFEVCESAFSKAFPLNSTDRRLLRVYGRAQNIHQHNLRINSIKPVKCYEWIKNHTEILSFI